MESHLEEQPLQEHELYNYAAHLLIKEHKSEEEANAILVRKGVAPERAREAIDGLQSEITQAKKEAANKAMLYGAMWCVPCRAGPALRPGCWSSACRR